jgi:hypothetical protein
MCCSAFGLVVESDATWVICKVVVAEVTIAAVGAKAARPLLLHVLCSMS